MDNLTKEKYEHQSAECDGKCVITEKMVEEKPDLMRCVTCPFCKELVDAIMTKTTISCPKCDVTVKR